MALVAKSYWCREWGLGGARRLDRRGKGIQVNFFFLAGCSRSLGYRQSRFKRRKDTRRTKTQVKGHPSGLAAVPRLMALCSAEVLRWPVEWRARLAKRCPPPDAGAAAGRGKRRVQVLLLNGFWAWVCEMRKDGSC